MAELKLSGTSIISDASGTPTLNAGVTLNSAFPAGNVINLTNYVKTAVQTLTYNVDDLIITSGDITPKKAGSKFWITCSVWVGGSQSDWDASIRLYHRADSAISAALTALHGTDVASSQRGGAALHHAHSTNQGYDLVMLSFNYLHTPTYTSTVTYEIQGMKGRTGYDAYINKNGNNVNSEFVTKPSSQVTIMEIAG
jgi:hypothetical protein